MEDPEAHRHVASLVRIAPDELQTQQALPGSLQRLLQVIKRAQGLSLDSNQDIANSQRGILRRTAGNNFQNDQPQAFPALRSNWSGPENHSQGRLRKISG